MSSGGGSNRRGVPYSSVPNKPIITNMDSLLDDIYVRYIALKDEDFEKYYKVIDTIFHQLHKKMKEVDPYYNKYSSQAQFAGSHPDRLRINKPDEFDIDIVIDLPISIGNNPSDPKESDIIFVPGTPGFTKLKMGVQFERLPCRDDWRVNKTAYEWKDDNNFLLGSKFKDWFYTVVDCALTKLPQKLIVDNVLYTVRKSVRDGCPAVTLCIENHEHDNEFKMDVDLVPALRFPIDRWPITKEYRDIPTVCQDVGKDYWIVVPKPSKMDMNDYDKNRSWGISMHEHEATLLHDSMNMKQAARFIKKLRDSQNMNKITSYFIKTIFFWELIEQQNNKEFWNQRPAKLFELILKKFHGYLKEGKIPCFWHEKNNLLEHVKWDYSYYDFRKYAEVVKDVLDILREPSRNKYKEIAKYLLTKDEFKDYSKFL